MNTPHLAPPLSRLLDQTADAVLAVQGGRSLNDVLALVAADVRPGVQALTFTVLRRLGAANEVRAALAPKTPPPKVDALLVTALALLWPDPAPPYTDHTLVDQAVQAARRRSPASAGFVNAVLRRFVRERPQQVAAALRAPVAAYNHPAWWIERLRRDWPQQWQGLLSAAHRQPPMTLRINARRLSGADYVRRLAEQGQAARLLSDTGLHGQAVVLERPCPVQQLPGFADGDVSVQDAAAQRAAGLLLGAAGLPAGARVLDACAAPGGKSAHLLERADLDLLALDSDATRLQRAQDTLDRLRLSARVQVGDASQPAAWWDGQPFDAILLDAPCSASGIVRRHPDICWLRRAADIEPLARLQTAMLEALWPLLAPGGRLLFATCSVFKAEGQDRIDAFLQRHGSAGAWLDPCSPGHLLANPDNPQDAAPDPGRIDQDGFFYALLRKP
ncbi:MAG: 16S rRNA (cytosine(967)-C(5))-methyltransferase RsmB [Rubrivivax sp.]|nr:16S rRNA (cytosine(967)-C(5))-methyltransferase RsmB [Rubrivivax sp.]